MNPNFPEKVTLAYLPTPIEKMERLTRHLAGPDLFIKRDDQTGLATGGNKTRKLEYLVADALAKGCDHLITIGNVQSNHCRQTAAAAAKYGLGCSVILSKSKKPAKVGNLLLDELLGAHIYWAPREERNQKLSEVVNELRAMGRNPYPIPLGGSNVIGSTGYVAAIQEFLQQIEQEHINIDFIVIASSSGGTQAGMVLGAEISNFSGQILGISVDQSAENLQTQVAALATATATHLGLGTLSVAHRISVNDDYIGEGYAKIGESEREAITVVAQKEGILLDPVYTCKAMAGIIDLIRWGAFTRGQSILFWHTGGTAALSAFSKTLVA